MECMMKPTVYSAFLSLAALSACSSKSPTGALEGPSHTTYLAQGDSATIAARLVEFRAALGGDLNAPNTPPADGGRREINWDGVPAVLTNIDNFPGNFFNSNSKRGVLMSTLGTGFRVDSSGYASVDPALAGQFKAFSPKKVFFAVGSPQVDVDFKRAGTITDGLVNGFGVIFTDVDRAGGTRVQYYDASGTLIATATAPGRLGAQEFSFVGVVFSAPVVARVRITSGEGILDTRSADLSTGGTKDFVVMDDWIYGEPQPVD
jgi:hypothetical protein